MKQSGGPEAMRFFPYKIALNHVLRDFVAKTSKILFCKLSSELILQANV
jgi:hypothetical protein